MFLIGADPEFFLEKEGEFASGYGLIPGTKDNPHPVDKGSVQVDGMALEFNVNPSQDAKEFVHNVNTVLSTLRNMVPQEYSFSQNSYVDLPQEWLEQQPPLAKRLGCDPDYNAYTGRPNPQPEDDMPFRSTAGHIHVGWTEGEDINDPVHFEDCCEVVKQLDWGLGLWCMLNDPDHRRMQMYGQAGAFRPKSYGVEYRVPSNFWIFEEMKVAKVFDLAFYSMCMLDKGATWRRAVPESNNLQTTIDQFNRNEAKTLLNCFLRHVYNEFDVRVVSYV